MTETTLMQRILRPVVNWVVETVYPRGAFFGNDFLSLIDHFDTLPRRWGTTEMACASYIIATAQDVGATDMTFDISGMTRGDEIWGDWRLIVRKIEEDTP